MSHLQFPGRRRGGAPPVAQAAAGAPRPFPGDHCEFEQGRAGYKVRDWTKAKKHFLACLTLRPDDGPAEMYLRRIEECEADPGILDANGVYTFKHK